MLRQFLLDFRHDTADFVLEVKSPSHLQILKSTFDPLKMVSRLKLHLVRIRLPKFLLRVKRRSCLCLMPPDPDITRLKDSHNHHSQSVQ